MFISCLSDQTDKGYLHFYDILESTAKSLELHFNSRHHYVHGPGEAHGVPNASLRFKMALEIDTGVEW
jgi:hypothetical protein